MQLRKNWFIVLSFFIYQFGHAVNGTNLIGNSARSRAMGGTAVGNYQSIVDALVKNAANLKDAASSDKPFELEAVGHYLIVEVKDSRNGGVYRESTADSALIPTLGAAYRLNDEFSLGTGMVAVAGLETDFVGTALTEQAGIHSELKVAKVPLALSYRLNDSFSFGVAPFLSQVMSQVNSLGSTRKTDTAYGFGAQVGVSYRALDNLNFGAYYASESSQTLKEQSDFDAFGPDAVSKAGLDSMKFELPAEFGLGAAFSPIDALSLRLDYKRVLWDSATPTEVLGWEAQNVIALGGEYKVDAFKLRLGYNYANSPIDERTGEVGADTVDFQGHRVFKSAISLLNSLAFPASTEHHLTFGGGYAFDNGLSLDAALVVALEGTVKRAGSNFLNQNTAYTFETKTQITAITAQVNYNF